MVCGQEVISGLISNPEVARFSEFNAGVEIYKSEFFKRAPLTMPFYDDFSELGVYPDTSRWMDNEAYINSSFSYYPVNFGVATLDAIDSDGKLYSDASPFPFIADHLTSKPIRLDSIYDDNLGGLRALIPADSIILSFYYQPQGRGDIPLGPDSLVLEFGRYSGDTIFSHYDSILVHGYNYLNPGEEFLVPGSEIFPPDTCDNIRFVLVDTLYFDGSVMIPCDSIFTLGTKWVPIWSAPGDTLETFIAQKEAFFDFVRIPIIDTAWLHSDFQFRFMNYASLSPINSWQSNTDQWNVDVVYLDYNRHMGDQYVNEVRFVEDAKSLIVDYSTMPMGHYVGDFVGLRKDSIPVFIHNNDSVSHNISYKYSIKDGNGNSVSTGVSAVTKSILPLSDLSVFDYTEFLWTPVKTSYFASAVDSTDFYITHRVNDVDSIQIKDSLIYHQKFRNYFAYDDGSAEAGYGLSPSGAMLAVKFEMQFSDTLRGVQMYFNKTLGNNNERNFDLVVWADNNGRPGERIYTELTKKPKFTNGLNRFYNLVFNNYIVLQVGVFYVGWDQYTNANLNIGYDWNTDSQNKNFYNVDGSWTKSSFKGSIMIHPLVGNVLPGQSKFVENRDKGLQVYPNPATQQSRVRVDVPKELIGAMQAGELYFKVFDLYGQLVQEGTYRNSIPVVNLKKGYYLLCLFDKNLGEYYTTKMLIAQ